MLVSASIAIVLAAAAQGDGPAMLICAIVVTEHGRVDFRLENPSTNETDIADAAELVLWRKPEPPRAVVEIHDPMWSRLNTYEEPALSYRAPVTLSRGEPKSADNRKRLTLASLAVRTSSLSLHDLKWYAKESAGRSGDGYLRRIVPEGTYTLVLEIGGWSSNEVRVRVDRLGNVSNGDDE